MMYTQDYDENFPRAWSNDDGQGTQPLGAFNCTTTNAGQPGYDQGWAELLQPYIKSTQVMQCPSEPTAAAAPGNNCSGYTDYASNFWQISNGTQYIGLTEPTHTVIICDFESSSSANSMFENWNWLTVLTPGTSVDQFHRHLGGDNFLFCDGHVKWLQPQNVVSRDDADYPCGPGNAGAPTEAAYTFCGN